MWHVEVEVIQIDIANYYRCCATVKKKRGYWAWESYVFTCLSHNLWVMTKKKKQPWASTLEMWLRPSAGNLMLMLSIKHRNFEELFSNSLFRAQTIKNMDAMTLDAKWDRHKSALLCDWLQRRSKTPSSHSFQIRGGKIKKNIYNSHPCTVELWRYYLAVLSSSSLFLRSCFFIG